MTVPEKKALPRTDRVRRRSAFRRIQSGGRRVHTQHFVLIQRASEAGRRRLGITVTKKIGNAVARNRVKRVVREAFRLHRELFTPDVDIVFIAKRGAPKLGLTQVLQELRKAEKSIARAGKQALKRNDRLREREVDAR
ncbi:MAG: ribonuclease P protein component [Polyangiales bacterium]|jgi:ribonuclease P protein component